MCLIYAYIQRTECKKEDKISTLTSEVDVERNEQIFQRQIEICDKCFYGSGKCFGKAEQGRLSFAQGIEEVFKKKVVFEVAHWLIL